MTRGFRRRSQRAAVRKQPKRGRGRYAFVAALLLFGLGALIFAGPGPAARKGTATTVNLPSGQGVVALGQTLERAGVIRSGPVFVAFAEISGAGHALKAGEYAFASGLSLLGVLDRIRHGEVVRHFITIPEGLSSAAVADILRQADYLSGPERPAPEGALLPETYEARRGDTRQATQDRMMAARDALLDTLWRNRAPGLPYRSLEQAVILASVVEKETAKVEERPRIAAVFINRLAKGMRLESDPTVIYGLTGGRPLGHGLRASELAAATPFNTYRIAGLPPTPIGNPGRAALAAALRPASTDALYFVADGTGGHVFAASFEAHRRNVAAWRALERARSRRAG